MPARILSLIEESAVLQVCREWDNSTQEFALVDAGPAIDIGSVDACLVDPDGLDTAASTLRTAKADAYPIFLPVVLVGTGGSVFAEGWPLEADSPVDDVVPAPIDQGELDWRLRRLIRRRGHLRAVDDERRSMQVAKTQLEILNRLLRHDIGTDLSIARSRAKQLRGELGPGSERAMVDDVIDACNRVIDLSATVRSVSKPLPADGQVVSLNRVVRESVERVQDRYPGAQVSVGDLPTADTVRASGLLRSVIGNLLDNAVQHAGEEQPRVRVDATVAAASVEVRVADEGPGIPVQDREAVFDRGRQGRKSDGSGHGLYLVRELVEGFGGSVWVEANEPTGAVVIVELPRAAPAEADR